MRPFMIVALGGVIVATIDLIFAIAFWNLGYGAPPIRILQSIAAGLLGRDSYAGGNGSAALGVACHYTIALGMAFAHYLVARRFAALVHHPYLLGAAYGALLYAVMNFVVLPLSAVGMPSFDNVIWVTASVAAHLGFGIVFAHASRIALRGI